MDILIESALKNFFAQTIGSDGTSKYLQFVDDDGAKGVGGRTSEYLSGKISYEKDGKTYQSQSIFCKLMVDKAAGQIMGKTVPKGMQTIIFVNELIFYSMMRPFFDSLKKIDDLLPTFNGIFLQAATDINAGLIIFDNLKNSEYISCPDLYLDYDHLAIMLRKIGQYHAYSYQAKKKNPIAFYSLSQSFTNTILLIPPVIISWIGKRFESALKPLHKDSRYTAGLKTIEEMGKNLKDIFKQHMEIDKNDEMAVLTHRACRAENVLFRYENSKPVDLKMLDWQTCKITSLAIDIIIVLYLEASQQTRDEKWDNLIDEYYTGLSQTFPNNDVPSKETIKNEIKKRLPAVLLILQQKFFKGPQVLDEDPMTDIIKDLIQRLHL